MLENELLNGMQERPFYCT